MNVVFELVKHVCAVSDMKARAPQAAIDGFNKVVTLEKESGAELEW